MAVPPTGHGGVPVATGCARESRLRSSPAYELTRSDIHHG